MKKPITIQPFPNVKKGRGQRRNRRNRRRGVSEVDVLVGSIISAVRLFVSGLGAFARGEGTAKDAAKMFVGGFGFLGVR